MHEVPTSSDHVGGGDEPPPPPVPEPPFAERARTLVHLGRTGALSTRLQKHDGYPFTSVAPYGVDGSGQPTLLISRLAVHTQNLLADSRASLLVTQPGWREDPLAGARVTLVGRVAPVPEAERAAVRENYLARQETARYWVDFGDFAFYRLAVDDLYYVAGFGAMGWVDASAYRAAAPDPLAEHAAGILEHMNADHADALVQYCRVFAGIAAESATMTGIDRMGFRVRACIGGRLQGLRINFPRDVRTPFDARAVLVEMVRQARERLG
ncbi:MAG: HugZ family protein [Candidatus Binatia bacterium]